MKDEANSEKNLDKELHSAEVGEKINLRNLNFNGGTAVFKSHSYPILKELLQTMRSNPNLKIEIQGHICCYTESNDYDVSGKRALAVYNYLIKSGIDKKSFLVTSYFKFLK